MNIINHIVSTFRRPVMNNGPSKLKPDNQIDIQVPFPFTYEQHDTVAFQEREGRMLPALRNLDQDGFPIQGQTGDRPWGPRVHILRLLHPNDPSLTILRKFSDSLEDASRMVRQELPQMFFGIWTAQRVQAAERESWEKLTTERNNLRAFITTNHGAQMASEIAAGLK